MCWIKCYFISNGRCRHIVQLDILTFDDFQHMSTYVTQYYVRQQTGNLVSFFDPYIISRLFSAFKNKC